MNHSFGFSWTILQLISLHRMTLQYTDTYLKEKAGNDKTASSVNTKGI